MLREVLTRLQRQLSYFPAAFRLVWQADRPLVLLWIILLLMQALLPVLLVYSVRALVDRLAASVPSSSGQLSSIVLLVAAVAGLLWAGQLLRVSGIWVKTKVTQVIKDRVTDEIHAKATSVDFGFYETPEYFDYLHRARFHAADRPVAVFENVATLLQNTLTLVAMAVVLLPFGFWLPLALMLSTVPILIVVVKHTLRYHAWAVQNTSAERTANYYDYLLTNADAAGELRLFGLGNHFRFAYQALQKRLLGERLQLLKQQNIGELFAVSAAYLVSGATLLWMVLKTVNGKLSLGDLALFYQAFQQGQTLLRSLVQQAGQIYSNSLFLSGLFQFLQLQPSVVDPPNPEPLPVPLLHGITLENVSFRYPNNENCALQDFNLFLPAGRITAIVGPNGAGKSTLIKLLCRLYDADEGSIKLDGINIKNFEISELRRRITVLFQQPMHYQATVSQNIGYGDLQNLENANAIQEAISRAGADELLQKLPHSIDTLLGKWFAGGTELSVGEWQRVALAKAFFRDAAIVLLDEPTSAMDSWAEAEWMNRLRTLVEGKTALIITHRFTTAMRADIIHVMKDGQIVESGSHRDLILKRGLYADSWMKQMERSPAQPFGIEWYEDRT